MHVTYPLMVLSLQSVYSMKRWKRSPVKVRAGITRRLRAGWIVITAASLMDRAPFKVWHQMFIFILLYRGRA